MRSTVRSRGRLALVFGALLLTAALSVQAADAEEDYCDDEDDGVNCVDPALNPGGATGGGAINPEVTSIEPGTPINIADDGAFDGIYQCSVSDPYLGKTAAYVSVNGHASGEMIFVLAGLDPRTDPYAGYGKGKLVEDVLTGNTSRGAAFAFKAVMGENAAGDAQATLAGSIRIKARDLALKAIEYDAKVDCVSIW